VKLCQNVCEMLAQGSLRKLPCASFISSATSIMVIDHVIFFQSHFYEHTYARDVVQAHNFSMPSL
jgi:hypothetical protein